MNDKQAHSKLKKIQQDTNSYRNSRREKNLRHETMNNALVELNKLRIKAATK